MTTRSAVLAGSLEEVAQSALAGVLAALSNGALGRGDATLAGGAAGEALLLAYAAAAGNEALEATAAARVDEAVAALTQEGWRAPLYSGVAGVGWAVAHLAGGEEAEDVCQVVDQALAGVLATERWQSDYDLISGLIGYGVYALERGGEIGAEQLGQIVGHLEQAAVRDGAGMAWFTAPELLPEWQRQVCPEGYFNLGLAHGVPGVIGLLAEMVAAEVERERATVLLEGAVSWMLAAAPLRGNARFPAWRGKGADDKPARLAWCYGDAGVAVPLLAAARALRRDDWEREARELAMAMARRSFEESGVRDTGICHGAAGVAHIFNRLYQATGEAELGAAARRWIEKLLEMRRPGEGVAGFGSLEIQDEKPVWVADRGLLTGAAGVGLVLLAAISDQAPDWDRVLMLRIPEQE